MDTNSICDYITVKCPICGKPYLKWSTIGGDQSACPQCRNEGLRNTPFHESFPDWRNAYTGISLQDYLTRTK